MKFVRDQQFYWSEPFAFSKARASVAPQSNRLVPFALLSVLFAVPLVLVKFPATAADVQLLAVLSIGCALFVVYVLTPLASIFPVGILVASDRLVVGGERIPFKAIDCAAVGTTAMAGRQFPVLSVQTRDGRGYLCGLGAKVDAKELSAFLRRAGVREPKA